MRWDDLRRSSNVEDYRGTSFGGPGLKLGLGGTLVVAAAAYFLGIDPSVLLGLASSVPTQTAAADRHTHRPAGAIHRRGAR